MVRWAGCRTFLCHRPPPAVIGPTPTHARTDLRLRLELRGDWLHLAVRDGSPRLLRVVASDPHAPGSRGLWLVEQLAIAWGINRHPDGGKVVWCTLKL